MFMLRFSDFAKCLLIEHELPPIKELKMIAMLPQMTRTMMMMMMIIDDIFSHDRDVVDDYEHDEDYNNDHDDGEGDWWWW